jgi:uncharacterized protein (TIGR03382 family)
MSTSKLALLVALCGLGAVGCGPTVTVRDNVDIDWDFIELIGPSNSMHTPYVVGASMEIYVHSTDEDEKMNGWTVESSDTSIFSVDPPQRDDHKRLYVVGHANGDGVAQLIVRDSGKNVQTRYPVEARLPDRAQIMAHGLLIIGKSETEASVNEVRLLEGGTATFLIRYYLGDRTLYGNGALSVDAPSGVTATTPRTWLFEPRDWLQVTPLQVGTSSLALKVNGQHFADVPLTVVDSTAVASVRILGADESHAKKGDWLVALGQASDSQSNLIYGVEYSWDIDGQAQTGWDGSNKGDLYRYKFDPAVPKMLAATYGSVSAVAMIHWGGGYVDSSNNIGCSAAPGKPATAPLGIALLLVALVVVRRRVSL